MRDFSKPSDWEHTIGATILQLTNMTSVHSIKNWVQTRKLHTKILTLVLLIGIGWFGWTRLSGSTAVESQPQTTPVTAQTMVISVSSSGTVASTNSRSVTTGATGVVKKVFAKNSQEIASGAPLLELELDQESKQAYTSALSSYQNAKNNLDSAKTAYYTIQADMLGNWDSFKVLAESDTYSDTTSANRTLPEFMIAQNEWLSAEAKYKQQQAVVNQAQTALSNASLSLREASPTVYAPIGGSVSGLSLQVGSVIAPNTSSSTSGSSTTVSTKIANITTTARPTIAVELTEIDVNKIQIGDKATITADALPDKTFTGSIVSIDTVGAVSSGVTSYPAVIMLDTDVPQLLANMSVTASIITDTKNNALVVPAGAVQTQNGTSTVSVMRDGVPTVTPVELGLSSDTQVELLSGVQEGDLVVTSKSTTSTTPKSSATTSVFGGLSGGSGMRMR